MIFGHLQKKRLKLKISINLLYSIIFFARNNSMRERISSSGLYLSFFLILLLLAGVGFKSRPIQEQQALVFGASIEQSLLGAPGLKAEDPLLSNGVVYAQILQPLGKTQGVFVQNEANFFASKFHGTIFSGVILGSMFILFIYHWILYLKTRNKFYLSYSYLAFFISTTAALQHGAIPLPQTLPVGTNTLLLYTLLAGSTISFAKFTKHVLEFAKYNKGLWAAVSIGVRTIVALLLLAAGLIYFNSSSAAGFTFAQFAFLGVFITSSIIAVVLLFGVFTQAKKSPSELPVRYIEAWAPVVFLHVLQLLELLNIVPSFMLTSLLIDLFLIRALVSFAFTLASRFESLKKQVLVKEQESVKNTFYDFFTELRNRNALVSETDALKETTVILSDIDDFRRLNGFFGHEKGDQILFDFASVMKAYASNAFVPFFQPIVDGERRIEKYECLMRMRDINGEGSYYSPSFFMDFLHEKKIYKDVSITVIEKSFSYFSKKQKKFSINLTYGEISYMPSQEKIIDLMRKYNIGHLLTIEITETEEVDDYDTLSTFLEIAKKEGAKIAIDDFGSGFSNLAYILTIEPDFVKIDGSLIKNIVHDHKSRILVENLVALCSKLNIKIIAEFISNEKIFQLTKAIGVDYFQGYYLGMPSPNIDSLLVDQKKLAFSKQE